MEEGLVMTQDWSRRSTGSGSPFESPYGYCRAVRVGPFIQVAGTAPIWPDGSVHPDPGVQAQRCLDIIVAALAELGARPRDVVRTRVFVTTAEIAHTVGQAHGATFGAHPPAMSMVVVAGLLDPRWLVEIEADAIVTPADDSPS
jgi:enamine deaminase RidA (YjgF/YER057c/UK114 family)